MREAPVDSRPRKLSRLYQISEKNKHLGVRITRAGAINPINYPGYPPELKLSEDNNEEDPFYDALKPGSLPAGCKPSNQLDYFRQIIKAYQGRDEDAVKYVKIVKELIDKPLDKLELRHVRAIMNKVKFPCKLDISVFYQLTGKLPHEGLEFKDEDFIIHFYNTFVAASVKLLGKVIRCRTNVLYHLLKKIGKEPNADLFQFMKGLRKKLSSYLNIWVGIILQYNLIKYIIYKT